MLELAGPPTGEYYVYLLSIALSIVTNIALSFVLVLRKKHSLTIATFILFLLSISLWGAGVLVINTLRLPEWLFKLTHDAIALGYIFMPVWLYLFAYTYTGKENRPLRLRLIFFLIGSMLSFVYLSWNTEYIKGHTFSKSFNTQWGPQTEFGVLYPLFLVYIEILLLYSLATIYRDFKQSLDPLRKIQSKFIVIAISIPLFTGTLTDAILPLFGIAAFPSSVPMSSIMSLVIGYAILRYGLFELSFENMLASTNVPIITMGINKEILTMNAQAKTLLKLKNSNRQDISIDDVIKEEPGTKYSHNYIWQVLRRVFTEKKHVKLKNISLLKSNGEKIRVSMMVIPVKSDNQVNAANLVVYSKDSQSKSLFRRDEILSIASHEIKTPLTSIKLIAQMLLKAAEDRKDNISYKYLSKMYTQLNLMTQLINDYMDIARLERGQIELHKERTNINKLVAGVVNDIKSMAGSRKLQIQSDPVSYAKVDKEKMSQVMINLIVNAVKYSPEGTTVFIRTKKRLHAVCIEVEDSGIGIAHQERRNIFKSYYRVKGKVGNTAGLGLGLYIAKKIVDLHKGKITLESSVGKGTTFRIFLPLNGV